MFRLSFRLIVVASIAGSVVILPVGPTSAAAPPIEACVGASMPFTDVSDSSYARADIACLHALGITTGTTATTFSPADHVTREQMAAFLGRVLPVLGIGCPDDPLVFPDVPADSFARDDIACIHALGITTGTTATTFSPADHVTREQMAAFLARLWEKTGAECQTLTSPFGDIARTSYAFDAAACLWLLGMTTGTGDGTFSPDHLVTREQMAAFLGRLLRAEPTSVTAEEILADLGYETQADIWARLHLSIVGATPDGEGNPDAVCAGGLMLEMSADPYCGYVDVGCRCVDQINHFRSLEGLEPFVRAAEYDICAAREARLAVEAGTPHFSDGCGWRSQASAGGGRGGDGSAGTVEKSVDWLPYLIYGEGPSGGHYQAMMTERVRAVSCSYYAVDRDSHRTIINYYELDALD